MRRSVFRGGLAAGAVFICIIAGAAFGQPWSGSGTAGDPYQIWTAADMQAIGANSNYWDARFRLEANIDLKGITGVSYNIIGSTTVPFTGVFDGNSHKIFNFTYTSANKDFVGLFGYINDANAVIKCIEIVEPNVDAGWGNNVGALAGEIHDGSIQNCQVRGGRVAGDYCVGGLVGRTSEAELSQCSASTTVWAHSSSIGGLGGAVADGLTSNCYSAGDVTGADKVGGLIGLFSSGGLIRNCYSAGAVSSPGYKGGLVGYHWDMGTNYYKCFWDSTVNSDMNGIGNRIDANVVGQSTSNMHLMTTFTNAGWDFVGETANGTDDTWKIDDGNDYPKLSYQALRYGGGNGDANDPYQIWSAYDMQAIGASPNDWDKNFLLMRDIDLSAYTGTSFNIIGNSTTTFNGVFDGIGHTISNFSWESDVNSRAIGLFGYVSGNGVVRNLGVENADINVPNCTCVSALIGETLGSPTILNCFSSGVVRGNTYVGGIAGDLYGQAAECSSLCTVSGGWVGVIAGQVDGNLTDSYAAGSVTGIDKSGGLAGRNFGTITNCYSIGVVNSSGVSSGGLVGDNANGGTIINSYSHADVQGTSDVGGLVGKNYPQGIIENCYSVGTVDGATNVGGFLGYNNGGIVSDCFWDVNCSGEPNSSGGTGKTTAQMHTRSMFTDAGWDFVGETVNGPNDIWDICDGTNYPRLSWQELAGDFACPDGVNLIDFSILGAAWYSDPNDSNWDPNCDISIPGDNIIDERDLMVFTSNWLVGM